MSATDLNGAACETGWKSPGRAGRCRFVFDYENHTSDTVQVDGKDVSVQIPFAVCSAVLLPSDTFYNIEVTNGKSSLHGGPESGCRLRLPRALWTA